jgi:hypothetical protein
MLPVFLTHPRPLPIAPWRDLIWRGASEVAYKLKNVRNAKHGTEIFSQPHEGGEIFRNSKYISRTC